jgi:hypothetical protein
MAQPLGQNQITKSQPAKEQIHGAKASPHRYRMVPVYQSAQAIRTRQNDSQQCEGTGSDRHTAHTAGKEKGRVVPSLFKAARERRGRPSTSQGGGLHDLAEATTGDKASCPRSSRRGMREVARFGHPIVSLKVQSGYYR